MLATNFGWPLAQAVMIDLVALAKQRIQAGLNAHPEKGLPPGMENSLKASRLRSSTEP